MVHIDVHSKYVQKSYSHFKGYSGLYVKLAVKTSCFSSSIGIHKQ